MAKLSTSTKILTWPKAIPSRYLIIALLIQCSQIVYCKNDHKYLCGIFYSETNFFGHNISFFDKMNSSNIQDELTSKSSNGSNVRSIKVENDCSFKLCNQSNLTGTCKTFYRGVYPVLDATLADIVSASCDCKKVCKCEDIFTEEIGFDSKAGKEHGIKTRSVECECGDSKFEKRRMPRHVHSYADLKHEEAPKHLPDQRKEKKEVDFKLFYIMADFYYNVQALFWKVEKTFENVKSAFG